MTGKRPVETGNSHPTIEISKKITLKFLICIEYSKRKQKLIVLGMKVDNNA